MKGNGRRMDLEEMGGGWLRTGRSRGRGKCGQDAMYTRRKEKKIIKNMKKEKSTRRQYWIKVMC